MKLIDLTHTFTSDMPVFPGDPKATLEQVVFLEEEKPESWNEFKLTTQMHVGTHIDAPFHMVANGRKLHELEPKKFMGRGVLIDARGKDKIDADILKNASIKSDDIVLLYTGFGDKYRTDEYFENNPVITEDFAQKLVDLKVKIFGFDLGGPDSAPPYLIHKILLRNEILIIENVANLEKLIGVKDFEVIALPIKLESEASPARVIAKIS